MLSLWLVCTLGCQQPLPPQTAPILSLQVGLRADLEPGQEHVYELALQADDFLEIHVAQHGVDVMLILEGDGPAVKADSPSYGYGVETLCFQASKTGLYRLRITAGTASSRGQYSIQKLERGVADFTNSKRARAQRLLSEVLETGQGYDDALVAARGSEDPVLIGAVHFQQAIAEYGQGHLDGSVVYFARAADALRQGGRPVRAAFAAMEAGIQGFALDLNTAAGHLEVAKTLAMEAGLADLADRFQLNLGRSYYLRGHFQDAIDVYAQVIEKRGHPLKSDAVIVRGREEMALCFRATGRHQRALEIFEDVLDFYRQTHHSTGQIRTRTEIATTWIASQTYQQAITELKSILEDALKLGLKDAAAGAADRLGSAHYQIKAYRQAQAAYEQALDLLEVTAKFERANVHANLARLFLASGDLDRCLKQADRAFAAFDPQRHAFSRAHVSMLKALAQQKLGQPEDALAALESAMTVITNAAKAPGYHLQRRHFTHSHFHFQLRYADLLLQRYFQSRDARFQEQAFQVLEDVRAQDLLARIVDREPSLVGLQGPVTIAQIQKHLLDADTSLVSYTLGESRSFAWVITTNQAIPIILGPGKDLHFLAEQVNRSMEQVGGYAEPLAKLRAEQLSEAILKPIRAHLLGRRVLLIKDRALHKTAFAALPDPEREGVFGESFRLVTLPSASIAMVQRLRPQLETDKVLVVADPVYEARDERRPYPSVANPKDYIRLTHTSSEAALLRQKLKLPESQVLQGLDANREAFLGKLAGPHQMIHLAMHGVLDEDHPQNSGLLFATYGAEGPLDGLLRASQLAHLDLDSQFIVLSGCQTALGKTWLGHGLWSLGHDFMAAGARRVLVSLWQVNDRHTAQFMAHFYEALLSQKRDPDEALAQAQATMRAETDDPNIWAAFTLQGDWTGFLPK